MHVSIMGGSGFIGQALVQHLLAQGHRVSVIGREASRITALFGERISAISWDDFVINPPRYLENCDWFINLAGASIGAKRWTQTYQNEVLNSRILTAGLVARECANLGSKAPTLFNASATGIYGLQESRSDGLPPALSERTAIDFNTAPDFLAKVARAWERATWPAIGAGVRVVNLRFGLVLAANGGPLKKMALPVKLGVGGKMGNGQQPLSWISLHDLIRAIEFIYDHPALHGPINCVAPHAVTQAIFVKRLGSVLKRPTFLSTPAWLLQLCLGEMADEILLRGQHVLPEKLMHAGFCYQMPNIKVALAKIYGD
ncbi:MAG: TIGR01777 family oxidoreductase [Gammaproteobacteria bacterium]|nr:TIGR01777 family oxidoreductase [Gammaproteobacteria bacterium]